jgi:hypothetical protein
LKLQVAENQAIQYQALQNDAFAVVLYSTDVWCLTLSIWRGEYKLQMLVKIALIEWDKVISLNKAIPLRGELRVISRSPCVVRVGSYDGVEHVAMIENTRNT